MSLHHWDERLTVGVPEVDEQHRRILYLANALHGAAREDEKGEFLGTAIFEMGAYVNEHFDDEERVMREIDYPAYEEHVQLHREMRSKMRELEHRFRGGTVRATEIHQLVVSWLIQHIEGADRKIADHLRDRNVA